ncbi:MAG: tRNA (adenosine(37)-N6)-dimethylallyltransferase MiaA [Reichenbachiella sp.]|uniref:tRNA (adenosine(37)-N6)-dimethylallyltransferase MiaA n=1 Tax=Reichenbachiella sp. TaxID=2184521 RepID=UPI0029676C94|nr:tRNA (adenosine(37)-N6)-dimethylallyltransferase MiaA [Reichenbachiella sp.]MDW3210089.1 tRNA (adenosine(37)-N6)-dimethylallyltransferase MiaA [Reichenbachiella sp.]
MGDDKLLVVVVGPTAVGKTAVTIALAQHFGGEIISSDSRQFYREMEIGTAKPDATERSLVAHHMVDTHSISEDYDAGAFASDVDDLLPLLFEKNKVQFMVGGSGLYVKAFCDGLDEMPETDPALREKLNHELNDKGLDKLLEELREADPVYFEQVDQKNPQRVVRGLEVYRTTGLPYSHFRQGAKTKAHSFNILKIGLEMDRATLYDRIDQRMDLMIEQGLFDEAKGLYPYRKNNALQTVGYKEIFDFIDGKYNREEAIRLLKRNSRRYAKRQLTWFRKDEEVNWFEPNQLDEMIKIIQSRLG